MKSTKRFISLTVLFFILIAGLTSCGNLFMKNTGTGTQPTPADEKPATGRIYGSVTTEGAIPSDLAGIVSSSRTAYPGVDFTSGYTFTAIATPEEGDRITQEFEGTSFTIEGLVFGKAYSISVEVSKDDSVVLSGTSGTPVTLSSSTPSASIGQIALTATAGGKGYIRLPIHCDDSSVTEVTVWIDNGEVNKTFFFDNRDTTIEFTGTSSGDTEGLTASSMTMEFYKTVSYNGDERKILAYQCKEAVNVFENLTTDTWVKNGQEPYLTTENGKVVFKLTTSCITNFELNTFYVDPSDDGRNNGSPFDPFTTLEQAVLAIKGSNSPAAKTILIKAGTTVIEPGEVIILADTDATAQNLTLGVYETTNQNKTATINKSRGTSFVKVNANGTFAASGIVFDNPDAIEMDSFILAGANNSSISIDSCTFNGPTGCTAIIYMGSFTLDGKNYFNNENKIVAEGDSPITIGGNLYTPNNGVPVIPLYITTPADFLNKNILLGGVSGKTGCFELSGFDGYYKYEIDSNGKLMEKTVLYVSYSSGSDEAGCGYSADKPFKTVMKALSECNSTQKTIWVEAGQTEPVTSEQTFNGKKADINVTSDLTSGTVSGSYTLNFSGSAHLIFQQGSHVSLTGVHFTRESNGPSDGGFIFLSDISEESAPSVSCTNCKFTGATVSGNGGAICNGNWGTLTLTGCIFSSNKASGVNNDVYSQGTSVILNEGNKFTGGIKLASGQKITIAETLNTSDGTIPLTLASYTEGTVVLDGDGMASAVENNLIVLGNSNYGIDSETGKIVTNFDIGYSEGTGAITAYSSLQDAVSKANASTYIGEKIITLKGGNEYTIPADYLSIDSGTLTIKSTPENTYATIKTNGGELYLHNNSTLYLNNIILDGNNVEVTESDGGIVYIASGNLYCNNCQFKNGKTRHRGGALYTQGYVYLNNCIFSENYRNSTNPNDVTCDGGQIEIDGNTTFSGPLHIDSENGVCENAIKANKTHIVPEGTKIKYQLTVRSSVVGQQLFTTGEGTELSDILSLYEMDYTGYQAADKKYIVDDSGYIRDPTLRYVSSSSGNDSNQGYTSDTAYKTIYHALASIPNNTACTIWVEAGGSETVSEEWAVYNGKKADIKVTNSLASPAVGGTYSISFSGNSTHMLISDSGVISLTGIAFTRNDTLSGGGGFIYSMASSTVTCTNCSFTDGKATGNGGAIFNGATLTLDNCTFSGNKADSNVPNAVYNNGTLNLKSKNDLYNDGIKLATGQKLTLLEGLSTPPVPLTPESYSAGTQIIDGVLTGINNIILSDSSWAIDNDGKLQRVSIPTSVYIDSLNGADVYYAEGTKASPFASLDYVLKNITDSEERTIHIITGHSETMGDISLSDVHANIAVYDSFDDITPSEDGSAEISLAEDCRMYIENGTLSFTNVNFIRNKRWFDGEGGIFYNKGTLNLTGCQLSCVNFTSSQTTTNGNGGLLFNADTGTATCKKCVFSGGIASESGGAIYNSGTLTVDSCTFTDCTHDGGSANYIYSTGITSSTTLKGTIEAFNVSSKDDSAYIKLNDKASVLFYHDDDDELYGWGMGDWILIDLQNASEYYYIPFYKAMLNPEENTLYISISPEVAENFGCGKREEYGYYCGYIIDKQ